MTDRMTDRMTVRDRAAFDAVWGRYEAWLSAHSPIDQAALRPPATAEEITWLERRLGFPLHPQLRALLERHDGVLNYPEEDNHHAGAFLPLGHRLSPVDQIASRHAWLVSEADMIADYGADDLYGRAVWWVPFALPNDGGLAFVDHCPGPAYGHVYELGIGSGCGAVAWASSLAELFEELSTSLETATPFRQFLPTPLELPSGHFCLTWDIDPRRQEPAGAPGGARREARGDDQGGGQVCDQGGGQGGDQGGDQGWPPARRPAVLRPAVPRPRPLTKLGHLVIGEAPAPATAQPHFVEVIHDIPAVGFHAREIGVTEAQNPD